LRWSHSVGYDAAVVHPRALVVEPRRLRWATQALRALGVELAHCDDARTGALDAEVVVVPLDGLEADVRARILEAAKATPDRFVLVASTFENAELSALFDDHASHHLLACNGTGDPGALGTIAHKVLGGDVFGLEKYLSWWVEPVTMSLRASTDREAAIELVQRFVDGIELGPRVRTRAVSIVDELTTNALYHAPTDEHGKRRFAGEARRHEVRVNAGEEIELRCGWDGRALAISVADPFGSLDPVTVFDHLARCLRKGKDQIEQKPGGAGLGLYVVFGAVQRLVVNIEPGKRTEIVALLDADVGQRPANVRSFDLFVV
jgi:hypothetical protein